MIEMSSGQRGLGFGSIVTLSLVGLVGLALVGVLAYGASTRSDFDADPWWETPSLAVVLLAPYLAMASGILLRVRDRLLGSLVQAAAGAASLGPAVLTIFSGIGLLLFPFAIGIFVNGLSTLIELRRYASRSTVLAAAGAALLLVMAPLVQIANQDARCVSVTRYADGRVERTTSTPQTTNGSLSIGGGRSEPGVSNSGSGCTSNYTTVREAVTSSLMCAAGLTALLVVGLLAPGAVAYRVGIGLAALLGLPAATLVSWAAVGPILLLLAVLFAQVEGDGHPRAPAPTLPAA